jgi:hypothetical protein
MKKRCSIDGCNEPPKYIESGLCNNCYAAMYYWTSRSKTPTEMLRRTRKLSLYQSRMDALLGNVKTLKKKRHG